MGGHTFICYSHLGDSTYVESLATCLTEAGVPVWFDKEIITGDRWERMIRNQIDTCAAFVVVMTPEAEASDWVTREIHRAETKAKPIFPLLLRDEVFFRLSNIQYEDVTGGRMPGKAFVATLRQLTSVSGAVGAPHSTHAPIQEALAEINRAVEMILGLTHSSALGSGSPLRMHVLADETQRIPPLIVEFALSEISRLSGYLKLLGQIDDLVYEGEDRDWLLGLTRTTKRSIDATSITVNPAGHSFTDGGLWASDLGQQYLEAQREASQRGVRIRRIFILNSPELRDNHNLISLMRHQAKIGVEIRTLYPEEVVGLQHTSLSDFIIFDNALSYHISLSPSRVYDGQSTIVTTTLVTDPTRVTDRISQYDNLWKSATPLPSA